MTDSALSATDTCIFLQQVELIQLSVTKKEF